MPIIKKEVTSIGNTGHVLVTKKLIGKEVWIITDGDMDDLKELIQITLLYRKAYKHDQDVFSSDYKDYKEEVDKRLKKLEDVIIV